eukprot:comp20652_c0_seq1/m.26788 comp20652_c0_seq1/g.26788  ORF comp20652_c0_seq1/g.26788 comp20652_c0_seq1/m.26788 type:complete len:326 (-) comp20652_c0_seq1:97-1074(-)
MALVGEGEQRCNLVDVESTWLTAARLRNKFARLVGGACSGEEAEVAWAKYAENLLARAAAVRKIEFGTGMAFLERAMEEAASQQLTLAGRLSSLFARTTEGSEAYLDRLEVDFGRPAAFGRASAEGLAAKLLLALGDEDTVCKQVVGVGLRAEHQQGCDFKATKCPEEGCGLDLSVRRLAEHEGRCLHRVMPCVNGCGENVCRMDQEVHKGVCSMRRTACPYRDKGCGVVLGYRLMEEHAKNTNAHLMLLLARVQSHQQRLAAVGAALEALEKEKTTVAQQEKARSEDISKAEKAIQKSRTEASKLRAAVHEDTKTVRMLLAGTT